MKKETVRLLGLAVIGSVLLAGCATEHSKRASVVVTPSGQIVAEAPPAPKPEVTGPQPSASYVWVGGYWAYHDSRWVWIPGHWDLRPRPGAIWVPGHWAKTDQGWQWTAGHWE